MLWNPRLFGSLIHFFDQGISSETVDLNLVFPREDYLPYSHVTADILSSPREIQILILEAMHDTQITPKCNWIS